MTAEQTHRYRSDASATSRRRFIFNSLGMTLSATAVALLSGRTELARGAGTHTAQSPAEDVQILNTALAAEREAVAAYQLGAESTLLTPPVLKVAIQFQGHHREHADALRLIRSQNIK